MSFQYLLMSNYQLHYKLLMKKLKGTGLSIGQPKILNYLSEHNGAKQADIAAACHIEPPSLTSAINGMEAKGMIERRRLGGDRRTYYIFLTARGRALAGLVNHAFAELQDEVLEHFSQDEREKLMQLLELLHDRLCALNECKEGSKNE